MKKIFYLIFVLSFNLSLYAQFNITSGKEQQALNTISVTIGGNFIVTGTFPALITEHADAFVTRLYNEAKEKALSGAGDPIQIKQITDRLEQYPLRGIILKRASGEELKIDLLKFRKTADFSLNPYLKNDDVLIFPGTDLDRNFFTVSGAVNEPGKFFFVDGDRLTDALLFAGGINKAYENIQQVEINRLSYDGTTINTIPVNANDAYPLQRGDRIVVKALETERKDFSVMVLGEVNSPGLVPVTKGSTTLAEVIAKAGGVTEKASLKNSRLYSGNSDSYLLQRLYGLDPNEKTHSWQLADLNNAYAKLENMMMYRMSDITEEDSAYFSIENQLRVAFGGSAVDFTMLNDPNSGASRYLVHNNDVIIIPQKESTVYVFGQVANPGRINYAEGKDYKYYIQKAGGTGEYAIDDDIKLIKGSTRNWISLDDNKNAVIDEGDYIWVPREPARSFNYYLGRTGTFLGILGGIATILLVVLQFR